MKNLMPQDKENEKYQEAADGQLYRFPQTKRRLWVRTKLIK